MKCTECKATMAKTVGDHLYTEAGLDNVILHGVAKYDCPSCGASRVAIPAMSQLHRAIAVALAQKPARLVAAEVAFLRDHLELSNKDFAELMGVSPEHASRWTSSAEINGPAERYLRALAVFGPEAIAARGGKDAPVPAPMLDSGEIVKMLASMPSKDAPAKTIPIDLRRSNTSGWKSATAAPN